MPDTIVELLDLSEGYGTDLSIRIYSGNTIQNGASGDTLTERTNALGQYTATVTEALAGVYTYRAVDANNVTVASGLIRLKDDTATYYGYDPAVSAATASSNFELMYDGTGYAGGTAKLSVNAAQVGGQTASASGTVTFPAAILASTTNIAGGTITTVSGNVDGNVGGNVNGAVAGAVGSCDGLAASVYTTIAQNVWNRLLAQITTSGSVGELVKNILNDWADGGRLDALLDAIPTTPMRGTDSANTTVPPTTAEIKTELGNGDWATEAGGTGDHLTAIPGSSDPWGTNLPGSYTSGQAGYIVGTNLDAQVSGVSGGGGIYTLTVPIEDSSGNGLQGARVTIDGTTYAVVSNSDGDAVFNVNNGTYALVVAPPAGYETPSNGAATVSGANKTATAIVLTATSGGSDAGYLG